MRQLVYAMKFTGQATRASEGPQTMTVNTTGLSNTLTTHITDDGVTSTFTADPEDAAFCESVMHMTGTNAFTQAGTITFGEGPHSLTFSTVEHGTMGPSADPQHMAGCSAWRVTGGDGQFAGATGYITSNFIVSSTGEVCDHQMGVIFLPA